MMENESRKKPYIYRPPLSTGQTIYRIELPPSHTSMAIQEDEHTSRQKGQKLIIPIDDAQEEKDSDSVGTLTSEMDTEEKQQLRDTLRRLSLYPHLVQRPTCEAIIKGKKMQFQVIGKRGDQIRIKHKREIMDIMIDDIREFKILH
ncbi:MAG: hypothetical protein FWJ66_11580 [Caldibacillus sp.]